MDAHFSISTEPDIDLVHIVMDGFFTETDIAAFTFTLDAKMRSLTCGPNMHITLCDVSAMKIQTQDMVAAFSKVVGHPKFRSRCLAFVTGSSLSRMQTRRLTDRDGVAYFSDINEARAWLLA